ncbi:acyltransferase [Vibrio fluvialis]|uniref:acyltransferase n=1 Tax=Vibrio fluvialis TaxID=676 RepID=UPI002852504D|nr:acyltransferase [Vibrio fluvialis]
MSILRRVQNKILFKFNYINYFKRRGVNIGDDVIIIEPRQNMFGSEPYLVKLGNQVTVSLGVKFVTHDGGVCIFRNEFKNIDVFGPISVGSQVFIGMNSIILPNVTIGDNCVIGAGSVVTKNVPSNSVYAGIPAKFIKDIDQYKADVLDKADYIRDRSIHDKKSILLRKFSLGK